MTDYKKIIPKEYYKDDHEPVIVETVGELKKALEILPDDLPMETGFSSESRLVVYNIPSGSPHLEIEEWDG